ncbi:hypothetical protein VUR80DRAFT_2330 [Thermomyces stellatus]
MAATSCSETPLRVVSEYFIANFVFRNEREKRVPRRRLVGYVRQDPRVANSVIFNATDGQWRGAQDKRHIIRSGKSALRRTAWCLIHGQFPRHVTADRRGLRAALRRGETFPVLNIFSPHVPESRLPNAAEN